MQAAVWNGFTNAEDVRTWMIPLHLLNIATLNVGVFLHTLRFKRMAHPVITFSAYLAMAYASFLFLPSVIDVLIYRAPHWSLYGLVGIPLNLLENRVPLHLLWLGGFLTTSDGGTSGRQEYAHNAAVRQRSINQSTDQSRQRNRERQHDYFRPPFFFCTFTKFRVQRVGLAGSERRSNSSTDTLHLGLRTGFFLPENPVSTNLQDGKRRQRRRRLKPVLSCRPWDAASLPQRDALVQVLGERLQLVAVVRIQVLKEAKVREGVRQSRELRQPWLEWKHPRVRYKAQQNRPRPRTAWRVEYLEDRAAPAARSFLWRLEAARCPPEGGMSGLTHVFSHGQDAQLLEVPDAVGYGLQTVATDEQLLELQVVRELQRRQGRKLVAAEVEALQMAHSGDPLWELTNSVDAKLQVPQVAKASDAFGKIAQEVGPE
eukprot:scaffold1355_cov268-Pinguiococcus_pyrenoidosus.AAC.15